MNIFKILFILQMILVVVVVGLCLTAIIRYGNAPITEVPMWALIFLKR